MHSPRQKTLFANVNVGLACTPVEQHFRLHLQGAPANEALHKMLLLGLPAILVIFWSCCLACVWDPQVLVTNCVGDCSKLFSPRKLLKSRLLAGKGSNKRHELPLHS